MDPEKDSLLTTLKDLQLFIGEGDLENIKKITECFHQNLARNKQLLSELYTSRTRCTTQTDLILAACQNKKADILYYILKETDILVHLTDDSFDEKEVNKQRTDAITLALTFEDFNMVEMLYDFWCGNLHWSEHNIKNIEMVGNVLKQTRDACLDYDDQLSVNFHCLLTFNAFQREMYTELTGLNSSAITPKETAITLLKVLCIHDEYSQLEKIVRKRTEKEGQVLINAYPNDESCTFPLTFIYYEVYFRKLDFNVALLLLENLYVLRKHLKTRFNKKEKYFNDNPNMRNLYKNAANTYEEIESAIYHFIYSTSEHWRWYLPGKREIIMKEIPHFRRLEKLTKVTIDVHMSLNAPVIHSERGSFVESLKKFKIILEDYVICDDPALNDQNDNSNVETLLNENYLRTVSYMRDHYSLIKIVNYIGAIEKTTDIDVIMVERVLHVVGEMLKSSDESHHLSPSTQALLKTAISVETIKRLKNIRNFLSKVSKGQLSTRIEMANKQAHRFEDIKQELIVIKEIINPILDTFRFILDKSLLEKGLCLLEQRIEGLPDEAKRRVDEIHTTKLILETGNYYHEVWSPLGLSLQLLLEIFFMMPNKLKIWTKIQSIKILLSIKFTKMLPPLLSYARQILKPINETIKKINQYDPSVQISKYPDAEEIKEIRRKLKTLKKKNQSLKNIIDLTLLNKINNYKDHWETVKGMLSFCITECELFAQIKHRLTDTATVTEAFEILAEMEAKISNSLILNKKDFTGIEGLHKDLIDSTKIKPDPRLAREKLISCLISRVDLLKQILMYSENAQQKDPPVSQLVQRFDHDVKFRITLEMVLADIANVLAECKITLMNKSSMLLRDINLGNVLDHGNPFLEVIGDIFNSHDLAAELVDKAIMFAKDSESIKALHTLFLGQIDYDTIDKGDLDKMDDKQKQLYIQLIESSNWKSYALLIPRIPKSQRP